MKFIIPSIQYTCIFIIAIACLGHECGALTVSSRRQHLSSAAAAVMTVIGSSPKEPAWADITNKVASNAALRNLKLSQKKLSTLEEYVSFQDYEGLKGQLRQAPVSELRKSAFTLVKGGEDGPDAELLSKKYQALISSLERMDSTATLAMRGRKIPAPEFTQNYLDFASALNDFIVLGEESSNIPVQY